MALRIERFVLLWVCGFLVCPFNVIGEEAKHQFLDPVALPPQAIETAEAVAEALNAYDDDAFVACVDAETFVERILQWDDLTSGERKAAAYYLLEAKSRLLRPMVDAIRQVNGSVKLMGFVQRQEGLCVLARVSLGDAGVEYTFLLLGETDTGAYQIQDWYQMSTGQWHSMTLGAMSKLMVDPSPGILRSVFGQDNVEEQTVETFKKAAGLKREQDFVGACHMLTTLPENIFHTRSVMMLAVGLAGQSDDLDLYKKMLKRLDRYHGHDPVAALMLLDYYYMEGDGGRVLKAVDVLEKEVGVDGYTQGLRANVFLSAEDYEQCIHYAMKAIHVEADYEESYFALAMAYTCAGQFEEAVKVYRDLEEKFGYRFERKNFIEDPREAELIKSEPFNVWIDRTE